MDENLRKNIYETLRAVSGSTLDFYFCLNKEGKIVHTEKKKKNEKERDKTTDY